MPPERRRFLIRLPHWCWFLLATLVLVFGGFGLSIWLPYHKERQVMQRIEEWGRQVEAETDSPAWLRRLAGEARLRTLKVFDRTICIESVHGDAVTDASLAHLSGLTNLKVVFLNATAVTDAGLTHLSGLTNLRGLCLDDTAVTDAGLAQLAKLTKLRGLYLNGTAVTDAGLVHLRGLTKLQILSVERTKVTDKGINEFKAALPDCEIEH